MKTKTKTKTPEPLKPKRLASRAPSKTKLTKRVHLRKAETPYDRTKHLLGKLTDLPPDLSTNPKYFETKTRTTNPPKAERAKTLKKVAPKLRHKKATRTQHLSGVLNLTANGKTSSETSFDRMKHQLAKLKDLPSDFSLQTLTLKGKSGYERIKHLSGILNGPGDLSTNPKYMEGYGE